MTEATWFDTARFGLFVHWGHSSQQGIELSWPLVGGNFALPPCDVPVPQYHASAATFDPEAWDAPALARAAKRLGMQYAVITAKHHDGYAMYDTRQSDFSIARGRFGRDVVREFVEAVRGEGLHAGIYYSLIDWHHPDYPAFTEADKPYVFGKWRQPAPEQWDRFREFMFAQVRELLTGYGPIDLIWFDGGWERTAQQWGAAALASMIRELQPGILINDRLPGGGDFLTPEQSVPAQPPARRWETCMTMNESWAYNPADTAWKSPRALVQTLCEVAGRGGNLLLNVGPMGDGALPPEIVERMAAIERWMARNGESIIGTWPGLEAWQCYGASTRRDDTVYVHLLLRPYDSVTVRGVRVRKLRSVRALSTGEALEFRTRTGIVESLQSDPLGEVTVAVPEHVIDAYATVLALEFEPGTASRAARLGQLAAGATARGERQGSTD
ncbi:MAG: alpha-L-fucosidase [Dehalococcoidia bacterium]|nr:alpha-L-fucosidase [Dehalococcoidia bacterium]